MAQTDETALALGQRSESGSENGDQSDEDISPTPQNGAVGEQEQSNDVDSPPRLSKKAQKRLLKAQRYQEHKLERRAKERAAKKAKRAATRAVLEEQQAKRSETSTGEGVGGEDDEMVGEETRKRSREGDEEVGRESKRRRQDAVSDGTSATNKQARKQPFGAKIVVDLGFDDKMTDREIISMVSQCAYCYSSNRKTDTPFSALLFTSLNGRTRQRFDLLNTYQNWKGVEWWEEGYEQLWQPTSSSIAPTSIVSSTSLGEDEQMTDATNQGQGISDSPGEHTYTCPVTKTPKKRTTCTKEKVVYLTADSNEELLELDPDATYIIGGIVDKNRYKSLCENKAKEQGVRTARLPIGIYLKELPTRKVLTVNQVFDILVKWVECRDWRKALYDVMPLRKFENVSKAARKAKKKQKEDDTTEQIAEADEEIEESGDKGLDAARASPLHGSET